MVPVKLILVTVHHSISTALWECRRWRVLVILCFFVSALPTADLSNLTHTTDVTEQFTTVPEFATTPPFPPPSIEVSSVSSSSTSSDVVPSRPGSSPSAFSLAVAGIIGVCGVAVTMALCLYGLFYCYIHRNRVVDLDAVEYCIQEEYDAKINFEALGNLDPATRAGIDMNMLAKLTNTDPALLDKYRVQPSDLVRSPSIMSQESLHRHWSLTVNDNLQRSSQDSGKSVRRVNTLSDLQTGLSNSSSNITMLSTKRDSNSQQGTTYLVERKAGDIDLLQVLSNTPQPRSISSDMDREEGNEGTGTLDNIARQREVAKELQAANEEIARWESMKEERLIARSQSMKEERWGSETTTEERQRSESMKDERLEVARSQSMKEARRGSGRQRSQSMTEERHTARWESIKESIKEDKQKMVKCSRLETAV